jgi:hypothetical protein
MNVQRNFAASRPDAYSWVVRAELETLQLIA